MTKAHEKQIKVNHTDENVPGIGEAPDVEDAPENITDAEGVVQGEIVTIPTEAVHKISSVYVGSAIEAAQKSDELKAWEKVADLLYELEHKKHTLPGLMQSRLGRLLERLP